MKAEPVHFGGVQLHRLETRSAKHSNRWKGSGKILVLLSFQKQLSEGSVMSHKQRSVLWPGSAVNWWSHDFFYFDEYLLTRFLNNS